jgi:hypothetical protein
MVTMPVREIWAGNARYSVDPLYSGPQTIRLAGEPTTIGRNAMQSRDGQPLWR